MVKNYVLKSGKRKTSIARVVLKKGKGNVLVNNENLNSYFNNELLILKLKEPLLITNTQDKYDVFVNVKGGGQTSQVDAIRQAIARAIVELTGKDEIKKQFLDYDRSLIVSDTRYKEAYKPNNSKARAKRQKSYR